MARERITYRFGRSAFRDFETGNTKEWLLSNGIGGYANSTIHGNSSRTFSAYLIASLHPPVDRVLVLAKTHEELLFSCTEEDERERLFALGDKVTAEASTEGVSVERKDFATQQYPGYIREGYRFQTGFSFDIWPEYCYQTDGITVRKRIALAYGKNETAIYYELSNHGSREAVFSVTPLFNFRPFGAVSEKSDLNFAVEQSENQLLLTPQAAEEYRICFAASEGKFYDRAKRPTSMATPNYVIEENELYCTDVSNGFTGVDNHFTPYELHIALAPGESKEIGLLCGLVKAEEWCGKQASPADVLKRTRGIFSDAAERAERLLEQAGSKDALTGRLVLSADHFLVRRESTGLMTVLAGYPWFADWGRDTMIAFTGLTLATGRFSEAREVLLSFAKYVSQGMLPNVFPNSAKEEPMYNTIDASLWYFYAVYKYLQYTTGLPCYKEGMEKGNSAVSATVQEGMERTNTERERGNAAACTGTETIENAALGTGPETLHEEEIFVRDAIYPVLQEIFESYRDGKARYGIHMDEDGLIMGGGGLDQLTWMDVRVGNIVVTPRHGKAVEINALWYNALCCMRLFAKRFGKSESFCELAQKVSRSFEEKFWNEAKGCLYDTVDENGRGDAGIRPNQIFAVSLPFTVFSGDKERSIVRVVYEKLYTPYGLRSLAQEEAGYRAEYTGRLIKRDLAYHMGTSWGYLSGAFFDAWAKTMCRGEMLSEAQQSKNKELLRQMLENFADHMADGCLGGIAEIFDGDFACEGRGCYTQAWSVAEVLRALRELA